MKIIVKIILLCHYIILMNKTQKKNKTQQISTSQSISKTLKQPISKTLTEPLTQPLTTQPISQTSTDPLTPISQTSEPISKTSIQSENIEGYSVGDAFGDLFDNTFQLFNFTEWVNDVKESSVNMVSDLSSQLANIALVEEEVAVKTALSTAINLFEKIKDFLNSEKFDNIKNEIGFLNEYVNNNKENIKENVKNYIEIIFSPMIIKNHLFFDNILICIKKIISIYQDLPQDKINNTKQIIKIIDESLLNSKLDTNQKNKLTELITNELLNLKNNQFNNITKGGRKEKKIAKHDKKKTKKILNHIKKSFHEYKQLNRMTTKSLKKHKKYSK